MNPSNPWLRRGRFLVLALAAASAGAAAAGTPVSLSLWLHAGPGPERDVVQESLRRFNAAHPDIRVELAALAEGGYTEQLELAARKRSLPCLLELDGPTVAHWAEGGHLLPLDGLPGIDRLQRHLLRTIVQQGTYRDRLYSLGQYDSGLALWGNRRLLQKAGVRIPVGTRHPWTLDELESALQALKKSGVPKPMDMKFNYGIGEWLTYGFSPILQSFGGDLVERGSATPRASGVLNGPASVRALQVLQNWVRQGWVDAATKDDDDFVKGRSAISHVGHWVYRDYRKALGDDLVLMPMPRFGPKAVTGAGSWSWAVSAGCPNPQAAAQLLAHLMSRDEVLRVTQANGAVPATLDAVLASPDHGVDGPLRLYVDQILEGTARVRPRTSHYPVITLAFSTALRAIASGADVKTELDRAAALIDSTVKNQPAIPR